MDWDLFTAKIPSWKNLSQGDAAWSSQKLILVWYINKVQHLLLLPPNLIYKVWDALQAIPLGLFNCSLFKWHRLLVFLCNITMDISGSKDMFNRLKHDLKTSKGKRIMLLDVVHYEITTCSRLLWDISEHPTHLMDINPFPTTWIGTTNASGYSMGGIYRDPSGQWYVWWYPVSENIQSRFVSFNNPSGNKTINYLELYAVLAQLVLL